MKKLLLLLPLLMPILLLAQGIVFDESQQWQAIQAKAKAENKMIFVDAYTTWCGPCKKMSAEVFPQKQAGDLYNARFINVKLDMEKGEGIQFAKTYKVNSFPQLLFIGPDGQLLHYGVGYMPVDRFVQLGQAAIDPATQIASLQAKMAAGQLTTTQKRSLANALSGRDQKGFEEAAKSLLAEDKDWSTKDNVMLVAQLVRNPEDDYFRYLWTNRKMLDEKFSEENKQGAGGGITEYLENLAVKSAMRKHGGYKKNPTDSLAIRQYLGSFFSPAEVEFQLLKGDLAMAQQFNNVKSVLAQSAAITKHQQQLGFYELNSLAWMVYEKGVAATPEQLEQASGWARTSVQKKEMYMNTDTLAHLLAKTGNKAEAKKWAERSIALGKAEGEDVSTTETLLQSL